MDSSNGHSFVFTLDNCFWEQWSFEGVLHQDDTVITWEFAVNENSVFALRPGDL